MATLKVSEEDRRKANLRVLQRLDSSVQDIVDSATHVALYEFQQTTNAWEKKLVEGSLFLVKKTDAPRFQLQILNRNSTDNWTLAVTPDMQMQNQDPYLILGLSNQLGERVIQGIWFHNGQERDSFATVLTKAIKALQVTADPDTAATILLSPLNLGGHSIPISHAPSAYVDAVEPPKPASNGPITTPKATTPSKTSPTNDKPQIQHSKDQPQQLTSRQEEHQRQRQHSMTPTEEASSQQQQQQQHFVLDKKSLQLSLLSLIQDDRFLDLIHAQYLKVAHARANRNAANGES